MLSRATVSAALIAALLAFAGLPLAPALGAGGRATPLGAVRSWYFAEGTTDYGFEEYICVQNPSLRDATVRATYMLPESDGAGQIAGDPFVVPPFSRTTITVGNQVGASDVSVKI
ncbi:MAG: hypothetical protein KKE56_01355, partial [Actinobacteria bacterium]|nr:hypothetical protein [Actinomycetota bacterium]